MANPDIERLLQAALTGSEPAILAYLTAVVDPRIRAKFDLVNFSLLQQVEALARAKRLREYGKSTSEIIDETTRLYGFNTRSLITGKGSGYDNARVQFAEMLKERAEAELASPPIQGDFPPLCQDGKDDDAL